MTAVPCNPINLTFSYKITTKKLKRANSSQDNGLHVCTAMYYTPVSNLCPVIGFAGAAIPAVVHLKSIA